MIKCVFISLFLFLLNGPAFAAPAKPELSIAIPDVAPFGYLDDGGHLKGIYYGIFEHLEKEAGFKFNYTLYPYARLTSDLANEKPDLVILFAPVCERNSADYEIQKRFQHLSLSIYLKPKVDVKSKNLRVARVRGTCLGFMNDLVKSENQIDVSDFKQALAMLELGRADGFCALDLVIKHNLKKHTEFTDKLVRFKTQGPVPNFEAVLCRRKKIPAEQKNRLEKALKRIDTTIE